MPRTLASGMELFIKNQGGIARPVILLDVQTADGATFFWSDFEGTYPAVITAGNQFYNGWIKSAAPFKLSRDLSTNAGDLTLQNLSGNTIDRDVSAALKNHEFEGAMAIMRLWMPLFDGVINQFFCYLSEQNPSEDECSFRMLQMFDPAQYDVADDIISELCTLRFKSKQCGSTGTATFCLKRLVQDCQDASRAAQERFNGVLTVLPTAGLTLPPPPGDPNGGGGGGLVIPNNPATQTVNAQLDIALPLMYGYCRVRGDNILLHELSNKTRVAFYILGEGEWDGIERLWINRKLVNQADTSLVHFHPGVDGTLGHGLTIESNGGDQLVDNFFNSIPSNFQPLTYSRKAYIALSVPPDPAAPDANLDVIGDYRTSKVRIFDATGAQTAYQFSTNGAWQILDLIIRKMIRPEWKTSEAAAGGGDLTAAEKARINFPAVVSAAAWCDAALAGGQKRFESSVAFVNTIKLQQALAQLCLISQLYVTEDGGQIFILPDQPRSSSFILTSDHVVAGKTAFDKIDLHGAANRFIAKFNDLKPQDQADIDTVGNSGLVRSSNVVTVKTKANHPFLVGDQVQILPPTDGSSHDTSFDGVFPVASVPDSTHFTYNQTGSNTTSGNGYTGTTESRFAVRPAVIDHEQHQQAIGARGVNLSPIFRRIPLNLDLGNNTMEQVQRTLNFQKTRNLGVDASPYNAPWTGKITAYLDAVDVNNRALTSQIMGDIITVDATVSEEYQGDYEIKEATINNPAHDGSGNGSSSTSGQDTDAPTIELKLLQYIPAAFSDTSVTAQSVRASISRQGLAPIASVDSNGIQRLRGTFRNNPTNVNGYFTGGNPLSQSGTSTTINVSASTIQFGDGTVSYNSGSVNPGSYGTWTIYARDPNFAGGAITYLATTTASDLTAFNDIVLFGQITTITGGGASGHGGGGGSCFSGNVEIRVSGGLARFDELQSVCEIETEYGTRVADLVISDYRGPMRNMGEGRLVTPTHLIRIVGMWLPASACWDEEVQFEGKVYTLMVRTQVDEERHFILADGTVAHNISNLFL